MVFSSIIYYLFPCKKLTENCKVEELPRIARRSLPAGSGPELKDYLVGDHRVCSAFYFVCVNISLLCYVSSLRIEAITFDYYFFCTRSMS